MLDIILRTCLKSKLDENIKNKFTRVCGADRRVMIVKCVRSLVTSINYTQHPVRLQVLDDNSDPDFVQELQTIIADCDGVLTSLTPPDGIPSYNWSALEQFRLASGAEDLVYSVEDDYLHEGTAIDTMINAYAYFRDRFFNDNIMIFPFDCPFRYESHREEPTMLVYHHDRYWRQVNHTTNTFLTAGSVIDKHFDVFAKLAREYPRVNEAHTINTLYKGFGNRQGDITVFNPIPSLAYHLSYAAPVEVTTQHHGWKSIWEKV